MKSMTKTNFCVRTTMVLLTLASAASAYAEEIPFRGTVQQEENQIINFPDMSVEGTGTGNATHLGRFTATFEHQVDLLTGLGSGSARFTGTNGDRLDTEILALGVPTHLPGVFVVMERHLVVGGTGRFEGATGTFVLVRLIDQPPSLASQGTIQGTIVLAKEK